MTKSLHESLEKVSSAAAALGHDVDFGQIPDGQEDLSSLQAGLVDELRRLVVPPSNNMGVPSPNSPKDFSHGGKNREKVSQKTSIDWLGFSSLVPIEGLLLGLQAIWPDLIMSSSKAGMRGYPKCKALYRDEVQIGLIGYGAKHGRNSVSLTGVACKTLRTDEQFFVVREFLEVVDARLNRVDVCFDFFKGEITFDYALFAVERGEFKAPKANKNPDTSIVASTAGDGSNLGRTLYIGPRKGEKFGRVYEKGLEVFAKLPEEYRQACTEREDAMRAEMGDSWPAGTVADNWLRLEVEFKRVDDKRPIPLDIILNRDAHFRGAYPFYATALGMGDSRGRSRIRSDAEMSHDRLIAAHRRAFGNHVYSLRKIGFTDTEILNMLDTGRHNQRILQAGIVDIEQQAVARWRAENQQDSDIPF